MIREQECSKGLGNDLWYIIRLGIQCSGEGIVTLHAAPNPFLLNKICLNRYNVSYSLCIYYVLYTFCMTSYLLGKGGYVFGSVGSSVCLFVCLFVCGQHYSKSYERIEMNFYGRVLSSTRKNWLNFGGDLGIVRWVNEQKNNVIVVAHPDRGADNDPEPFFFFFFFFFEGGG